MTVAEIQRSPRRDRGEGRARTSPIFVNCRASSGSATGIHRYLSELLGRLGEGFMPICPGLRARGIAGHLWEQLSMPALAPGLLWSPANTGPIGRRDQVVTIHDVASLDHPEWFRPAFARWYRFLAPRLARRSIRVLTVSEFSKERIVHRTGVDPDRVLVIPNGVSRQFRPPEETETEDLKARHEALRGDYILYVGSLEPRKNLGRLFAAWELVRRSMPEVKLVVAGVAGWVFSGTGFGPAPEGVEFLGRVEDADLPALYGNAIALVYPSLYEGFGLPPLEALACGTAAVVSDASWIPEGVAEVALKVDPLDVESIADGLRRIVEDRGLRESIGRIGRARVGDYTWERAAERTKAALRDAANIISSR